MATKPYGLRLAKTSDFCPEQYDVFDKKGKRRGYIRIRRGRLTVEYPHCGGELLLEVPIDGHGGYFNSEGEREYYLDKALQCIHERMANITLGDLFDLIDTLYAHKNVYMRTAKDMGLDFICRCGTKTATGYPIYDDGVEIVCRECYRKWKDDKSD